MWISGIWTRTLLMASLLSLSVVSAQAADKRLFPADTELVVTINVKQALDFRPSASLRNALNSAGGALRGKRRSTNA